MSSIKVVDVNEEAKQEEPTEQMEEVKEEEPVIQNELVEETKEEHEVSCSIREPKEQPKEELTNNSKTERYKDNTCPTCSKSMLLRSYRYKHEKIALATLKINPSNPKQNQM